MIQAGRLVGIDRVEGSIGGGILAAEPGRGVCPKKPSALRRALRADNGCRLWKEKHEIIYTACCSRSVSVSN